MCAVNARFVGCDGSRVNVCTVEKGNKYLYRCVFFLYSIIIHQCIYKSNPTGASCSFHLVSSTTICCGWMCTHICRPRMDQSHCGRTRV